MLISPELLQEFNGIHVPEEGAGRALVNIHIGTACQIINDYVGFDSDEVLYPRSRYTQAERSLFQTAALRIATLLQMEGGGNIGVNTAASEMSVQRSYLNITDYSAYLRPLAAFRRNGGVF